MANQQGTVSIEGAKITFLNFAGKEGQFNREGDRNFVVLLTPEMAEELTADGWNVKALASREEGEEDQPYLQISVGYKAYPPRVVMIGGQSGARTELGESEIELLDGVEIDNVDFIFRPYNWEVSGKTGKKAYLKTMFVTIVEDPLELKYALTDDTHNL
jgi:hypothetical protein